MARFGPLHDAAMPPILILPGTVTVLFLIRSAHFRAGLAVAPARFLEGLRAACDALSFSHVDREDPSPEELLPWAGNV
jgi:hypothetical protein